MSASLRPQITNHSPSSKGCSGEHPSFATSPKSAVPSKRPDDDDDIQFISSQPVKRQKVTGSMPEYMAHQHNIHMVHNPPTLPIAIPPTGFRDSDRRISTGMVGLPSDINVMELTSALRGVSLPVLEKFVFNQPFRKPRPPSPPELSPKQLPQSIEPARLDVNTNKYASGDSRIGSACTPHTSTSEGSVEPRTPAPNFMTPNSITDELHVLNPPSNRIGAVSPPLLVSPKETELGNPAMPPPSLPKAEISKDPKASSSKKIAYNVHQVDPAKHPCQVCLRMRQHANIAQTQGYSLLHHNMPHHMIPQMAYHIPYGQRCHPTMGHNNLHGFNSCLPQVMMPMPGSNLAALPSHMIGPVQINQTHQEINPPPSLEQSDDKLQSFLQSPPPPTSPLVPGSAPAIKTTPTNESPITSNPMKPPASLIQPTYRKPSPNLIVDVAETCQEKFPFEEVAKRHNVSVEKVFDVFAAIIQVPLLRCPTDRRRAGRLATSRVKEYTKAKKAIQENGGQSGSDSKGEVVTKLSDIADRLGQVDFPDGFNPEE
ncbi:hypothetical protein F5B19DRAFT_272357 [Rostrohypoxylon terebratum]|nr:hypothetical protein F5B19DRAFT_272357 [Rostrohypoxylon terebratum]